MYDNVFPLLFLECVGMVKGQKRLHIYFNINLLYLNNVLIVKNNINNFVYYYIYTYF